MFGGPFSRCRWYYMSNSLFKVVNRCELVLVCSNQFYLVVGGYKQFQLVSIVYFSACFRDNVMVPHIYCAWTFSVLLFTLICFRSALLYLLCRYMWVMWAARHIRLKSMIFLSFIKCHTALILVYGDTMEVSRRFSMHFINFSIVGFSKKDSYD